MDASESDSSDTEDFFHELASLKDIGLLRATMESLECGRLTPLIKEELRCRIQSRRLSEGKEELLVGFPSPTPSQPRPDEVEKRDRRREQNRRAAQKFRKKKKERGEHLIEETQRLEFHNTSLRSEITQLHEEREQLTRIIQTHASVCLLTPRHSPLTVACNSPVPAGVLESPATLPPSSSGTMATSPVLGKRSALTHSPDLPVSVPRRSPVPLLVINSDDDAPGSTPALTSSPVSIAGRPRKSPVSLLRSPDPGDTSGANSSISCGSPAKQTKHSVPPRLSLAGQKPIIPILPKSAHSAFPGSPSPRTPKSTIASPSPIAPSPVSGSRAVHASPVFFSEGGFTPSSHSHPANHSPLSASNSCSSSTPGRIAQPSPIFFGDRAPRSADTSSNFLQPLSTSSVSSTSSLASLLRQESPLSVLSNSSGISNASSVFITNNTNPNTCFSGITENPGLASNNDNSNIFHSFQDGPQSIYSTSSQSSFPDHPDDNVLSLEEIEKSASGFEAREDLLDFMDIQALLELGADHNGNDTECHTAQSGNAIECHITHQNGSSGRHVDVENINDVTISASKLDNSCEIRHHQSIAPTSHPANQGLFSALISQNINPTPSLDSGQRSDLVVIANTSSQCSLDSGQRSDLMVSADTSSQCFLDSGQRSNLMVITNTSSQCSLDSGQRSDLMVSAASSGQRATSQENDHNQYPRWNMLTQRDHPQHTGCVNTEQDKPCRNSTNNSGPDGLQRRGQSLPSPTPLATNLHHLHNLLRDIILAQNGHTDSVEANTMRNFLLSKFSQELEPELTNSDDRN